MKQEWQLFKAIDIPIDDESVKGLINSYAKGHTDGQKQLLEYLRDHQYYTKIIPQGKGKE